MIAAELAEELQPALSTAIATLIEDGHEAIIIVRPTEAYGTLAKELQQLGSDIIVLSAAMAVVARRTIEDTV